MSGSKQLIGEVTSGAAGIAGAMGAAMAATRQRQAEIALDQAWARVDARRRVVKAKQARNQAMARELAALNGLIAKLKK